MAPLDQRLRLAFTTSSPLLMLYHLIRPPIQMTRLHFQVDETHSQFTAMNGDGDGFRGK